jgi:rod shape-determining protein MreC
MQHTPPPLFKQGASARIKVVFFVVLSIALLLLDSRLQGLSKLRQGIATVLYPIQMLSVAPVNAISSLGFYFRQQSSMEKELKAIKEQNVKNAEILHKHTLLLTENNQLRKLLDVKQKQATPSILAEIIYDAHDPFTRKIILDKGSKHGVALSQPVIDDRGVVGQITRVFPLTAEVTLLTDKNHAIPVQIARNGIRSVVYGRGQTSPLGMRSTTNADVQKGDLLVTSGIDGIYPEGLLVARVDHIESKASTTFENVLCNPVAGIDEHKQFLILMVKTDEISPPETEEVRNKKEKINRRVTRDAAKEPPKADTNAAPASAPAALVAAPSSATQINAKPVATGSLLPAIAISPASSAAQTTLRSIAPIVAPTNVSANVPSSAAAAKPSPSLNSNTNKASQAQVTRPKELP